MFTNKKGLRIGLGLFFFLSVIQFTIGYIEGYYKSTTGNELLISETWKTVLLDAPEGILVILGAIALYQFTKKLPEKTESM
ncbi:DUF3937 family protein [Bacillus pseudomycoides]|uniref:DUF3937 domain-containing protein n=1 Tax=Bacillus pseudomycoides TaxID=64104 RepID=A0A2B5H874_9BACI|nr:DUF3937 family protein [Bacillus pseudomycoides]PDY43410.1 hypothetical protein CON79_29390 [Bacillus pseudomycoides]PEA82484.1 hypothetical protein CON99_16835 [Bacillus pseudomycoides]PED07621.1 hypothetical protein COO19_14385 [Bacillus pseudomycoides]PED69284.1 hypothetical protein CON97_26050 [Bacillus pseudomycoides]PEI39764.1 hypothetical protein CN620_18135 [Bacillus pseudomycoides]